MTSIGSPASLQLSEQHSNSFDHSLNIITEATDSAAFANITCGIQGLSLTPAPVEPQLHLLVKHRHDLQSPPCSSTGKTQMKAEHHGLTIWEIEPISDNFRLIYIKFIKKGCVFIYHPPFTWTRRAFIFDQSSGDVSETGVFFNFSSFHLHLDCIFQCRRSYTVPRSEVKDRLFSHSHTTPSIIQRSAAILQVQDVSEMT